MTIDEKLEDAPVKSVKDISSKLTGVLLKEIANLKVGRGLDLAMFHTIICMFVGGNISVLSKLTDTPSLNIMAKLFEDIDKVVTTHEKK